MSGSPDTAAAVRKPAVVSKLICRKGLELPSLMPVRLNGRNPPPKVMVSATRLRCRGSTSIPYTSNTPLISLVMALRAASTPYFSRMAFTSLAPRRPRSRRSSSGARLKSWASRPQMVLKSHPSTNRAQRLSLGGLGSKGKRGTLTSRSTTCARVSPGISRTTVVCAASSAIRTMRSRPARAGAKRDKVSTPSSLDSDTVPREDHSRPAAAEAARGLSGLQCPPLSLPPNTSANTSRGAMSSFEPLGVRGNPGTPSPPSVRPSSSSSSSPPTSPNSCKSGE
mmetsp:Transcript_41414/g.93324  ORF Transcript_41414/g.93324 Transcript_41414/m.93324 type:complete len:281 (-) Transcript_41414:41-883(-)